MVLLSSVVSTGRLPTSITLEGKEVMLLAKVHSAMIANFVKFHLLMFVLKFITN